MDDPENDPRQPSGAAAVYAVLALALLAAAVVGGMIGSIVTVAIIRHFGL